MLRSKPKKNNPKMFKRSLLDKNFNFEASYFEKDLTSTELTQITNYFHSFLLNQANETLPVFFKKFANLRKGDKNIEKIREILNAELKKNPNGVTKYQDEFKNYNVRCPIHSSSREIGKDVIVINNNSLRNPCYDLIHHYAILLGHVETTLLNCLINVRDSGGVPIASTEKQKQSINAYHTKLFNGEYGVITDSGQLGIEYAGTDRGTRQDILNIMEVREKIIKSFYSDIGVRSAFEKRNNTVMAEVEADTSLLLLNLSDMIDCRKKAADDVNNMFGTNWSVHIAKEIDYSVENEHYKFDTDTETHIVEEKNNENYNS